MRIWFDKINEFIKIDNGIRYLALDHSQFDKICDSIKYLFSGKSGIADSINHSFARIRIDSYSYIPIEKNESS